MKYVPRSSEVNIHWDTDEPLETMRFDLPSGRLAEVTRETFEFFFAPVLTTTAEVGGSI